MQKKIKMKERTVNEHNRQASVPEEVEEKHIAACRSQKTVYPINASKENINFLVIN